MNIKRKINLIKNFGFKIFFSDLCASNIKIPKVTSRWKDKIMLEWIKKNYDYLISEYKNNKDIKTFENDETRAIWSMWWQGEENAPELVKMCFSSIRKNCNKHKFNIITKENYNKYIELPEHIIKRISTGEITLTHLSDIIRMKLLYNYGGLWLDSTILVINKIPEEIFEFDYYTIRREKYINDRNVSLRRWILSFQAAKKGNKLCKFVNEFLIEYWRTQKILIDYVLFDYAIAIAYEEFSDCRKMIDSVPLNNPEINNLWIILNKIWNEEIYNNLTKSTNFFKLTYKTEFKKIISKNETFYGKLLKSFPYNNKCKGS